jgi:hypothetical protein
MEMEKNGLNFFFLLKSKNYISKELYDYQLDGYFFSIFPSLCPVKNSMSL